MLKPRVRIPLWAAAAIPAAAYLVRSIVRGWNFAPDLPLDALLGALLILLAGIAYWIRTTGPENGGEHLTAEMEDQDDHECG